MQLSSAQIQTTLDSMRNKRVIVIGDFMLDRYIWGDVRRISPEAPVPVVEVTEDAARPGGAGNVVLNLARLGARCDAVGLIGDDENGHVLSALLTERGGSADGLTVTHDRPTTVKTRVIAGDQQLLRVDREQKGAVGADIRDKLIGYVREAIPGADAVILQDYDKGALGPELIRASIDVAHDHGVPVTVDPKSDHFWEFAGATLFKPNRREAEFALRRVLDSNAAVEKACWDLRHRLQAEKVLITRGAQGMSILSNGDCVHIETRPRHISDVSGAGDTVISTITLALAAGMDAVSAARLATRAAEYVVGMVGVVPVTPEALLAGAEG